MKALLFILLPFIIFNLDFTGYSFSSFIDFLQQSGYYEVIRSVKIELGEDIAIAFCKEFVPSNDCENVVTIYIKEKQRRGTRANKIELIELLFQEENLNVIEQSYDIEEMKDKVIKILKNK